MQYPKTLPEAHSIIDNLQARIDALESASSQVGVSILILGERFKLAPQAAKIVALLSRGAPRSRQQLYDTLDSGDPDWNPSLKLVDVVLVSVRKRLWPYGLTIVTINSVGSRLTGPLEDLRAVMDGSMEMLPVVRGPYKPRPTSKVHFFTDTLAGRIFVDLSAEFQSGKTFSFSPSVLARKMGKTEQGVRVALQRLHDLGYVDKVRRGDGPRRPPAYRILKTMEKAA